METIGGNASDPLVNGTLCDDCFLLNTIRDDVSHQVCDLLKLCDIFKCTIHISYIQSEICFT